MSTSQEFFLFNDKRKEYYSFDILMKHETQRQKFVLCIAFI